MGLFNKTIYNAYIDEREELAISSRNGKKREIIKDYSIIDEIILETLKRKPEEVAISGNVLILEYGSFVLKIDDYETTVNSMGSLKFNKMIARLIQKENVTKYQYRSIKRTNKHAQKAAIAIGLSAVAITSSMFWVKSLESEKNTDPVSIKPDVPTTSMATTETTLSNEVYEKMVTTTTQPIALETQYTNNYSDNGEINISIPDEYEIDYVKKERVLNNYQDIIYATASKYGVDPRVLCAIACVEGGSSLYNDPDAPAVGIFQIEKATIYPSIQLINYVTGEIETLEVTSEDKLLDPEFACRYACAFLQDNAYRLPFLGEARDDERAKIKNGPLQIVAYNKGIGAASVIVDSYCQETNQNYQDVIENPYDTGFIDYISYGSGGDDEYLFKVLAYLKDEDGKSCFYFTDRDGNKIEYNIDLRTLSRG